MAAAPAITPPPQGVETPLVLGATGRIGAGFQRLAAAGLWPGPPPLWQVRDRASATASQVVWDILASDPPAFGPVSGIIALAGVVRGDLGLNTALALAAVELARKIGRPVLLTSSAAVYGRISEPADEDATCAPISPYGHAKLAMEQAVARRLREMGPDAPPCCILRIGNVAGVDSLLEAAARGPVSLDQFSDGHGPVRSYIGMQTLAQIMLQLIGLAAGGAILPPVLNIAAPQPVHLADLLRATRANWSWRAAPAEALPQVVLDTRRLAALVLPDPLSPDPAELVRQARLAGWAPQ